MWGYFMEIVETRGFILDTVPELTMSLTFCMLWLPEVKMEATQWSIGNCPMNRG
jgi:hypothetical protein